MELFEDVVAEQHHHPVAAHEALGERQRVGDAAGLLLHPVRELAAEPLPRAQRVDHVPHVVGGGDDHDFVDARAHELLHRVPDHGLAAHWQQVLVSDLGKRVEAGAAPTGQDYALHTCVLYSRGAAGGP
jgi:hypothetical protein